MDDVTHEELDRDIEFTLSDMGQLRREEREIVYAREIQRLRTEVAELRLLKTAIEDWKEQRPKLITAKLAATAEVSKLRAELKATKDTLDEMVRDWIDHEQLFPTAKEALSALDSQFRADADRMERLRDSIERKVKTARRDALQEAAEIAINQRRGNAPGPARQSARFIQDAIEALAAREG